MQSATDDSGPSRSGRQKKTRRRLRVSCVECTRRRQKCDRQQPCGLCKSRGVEHLCRWELEPFARPTPARPPSATQQTARHGTPTQQPSNIASTSAGTSSGQARVSPGLVAQSSPASSNGTYQVTPAPSGPVDHDVKEAAITLAQLSVARHGEFLGAGSLVCALHRLDDQISTKIPTEKSSNIPFSVGTQYSSSISSTFTASLQHLILSVPEKKRCDELLAAYFKNENWVYGIPENLFYKLYTRMWDAVQADFTSFIRVDFNWMTLLFTIFAVSSGCQTEEESRKYYLQALTGKRLAEDLLSALFVNPRPSEQCPQGTALACMAAGLLAQYLLERGQMTEAWKLIGNSVRSAQNGGLHLNPAWSKWKDMDEDEKQLRIRAWHLVSCKDKFLSFILGRPAMIRARDTDVPLPKHLPATLATDGSSDTMTIYCTAIHSLAEIAGEEKDKYLAVRPDPSDGGVSFDLKMDAWEASLPPYFSLMKEADASYDELYPSLVKQRTATAVYYCAYRMLFHRSLCSTVPVMDLPESKLPTHAQMDYAKLAGLAINLLRAVDTSLKSHTAQPPRRQTPLTQSFMVFEAAITLSIAILRGNGNTEAKEQWRMERDAALRILEDARERDNGDIVRQAVQVLRMLQNCKPIGAAGRMDTDTEEEASAAHDHHVNATAADAGPSRSQGPGPSSVPAEAFESAQAGPSRISESDVPTGWPLFDDSPAAMGTSTLPSDVFSSLDIPMDWLEDSVNGTVSAFDLLHSMSNGSGNMTFSDLFNGP